MNILNRGQIENFGAGLRDRAANAYQQFAESDDYRKNRRDLSAIQYGVVILSAISTGITNAFAHRDRIGDVCAFGLALLVVAFVERLYIVLHHGLTTTYKSGKQRLYASACYRLIQLSMILNAATLVVWIVGLSIPPWLAAWNHWSIAVHFGLALIGVPAILDADAVVENRLLELKAETARQDLITLRRAAAIGSPFALLAARVRGTLDALALSFRLLFSAGGFSKRYMQEIDQIAREQFGRIDTLPAAPTKAGQIAPRRPGFVAENPAPGSPPKAPAPWI